jgi:glycosyltransferase involved in cell wall biosynthesis
MNPLMAKAGGEKKMKVSVVIPTYNHCEDLLKPCIESILKYTDLSDTEIIVSANGCRDNTKEYVESLGESFKLVWEEKAVGFSQAINNGILASTGDYIVLLNNDVILLEQPKNSWINMLLEPFKDNAVGLTGPILGPSEPAGRHFIIFFCVTIKREVIQKVGLLDTIFQEGGGEDTDYCIRAEDAGYKLVQVPSVNQLKMGNGLMLGGFPIYHKGEATVHDTKCVKDWQKIFDRNSDILRKKYNNMPKVKLNLGCGPYKMSGYINIDLYDKGADMNIDVRDLSYFKTGSVDEVFSSHLLEHFSPYHVMALLKEWNRVLKPGGKLILELPDIEECCRAYAGSSKQNKYNMLTNIYGATETVVVPHLYGWDFELLSDHLSWAGFKNMIKKPQEIYHSGYNMRVECLK